MNSASKESEEQSEGWVRCKSKSNPGRQYYFNRSTGKSSWTQPQPGEKLDRKAKKNEPPKRNLQKGQGEGPRSKSVKRKSNEGETPPKKKHKNVSDELEKNNKKVCRKAAETKPKPTVQTKTTPKRTTLTKTPPKRVSLNDSSNSPSTPMQNKASPSKVTPKNMANKRLSQLRSQLDSDIKHEIAHEPYAKKTKLSTGLEPNVTPVRRSDLSSLKVNGAVGSAVTKSPSSDSYSNPSPPKYFAANKIISTTKAQVTEEDCNKNQYNETFADFKRGINRQATEHSVKKHSPTPPQFSEARKMVSTIKSKLETEKLIPKDVTTYSSAKSRMEALRASISGEIDEKDLCDDTKVVSDTVQVCCSPQTYEEMEVDYIKESNEAAVPSFCLKDNACENGQVVLVVDTNIFIHELDFIKNVLTSHIKGYSEPPTLLVPWRVINELDRLKDNSDAQRAVGKPARAAMDYLYKSLPENNRIKGQSLRDANAHIYPCEMPDDEILNCALQQAERGNNVLLLSNDRNLCNKATINGIKRCGIAELKELMEHKHSPNSGPDLLESFNHYQHTIYQLLANILENEMRAQYSNLWLHVLFKAPPWRLADVLQCLLKHWIAVFSGVFPRIEHLITNLKNTLAQMESKDPKNLTEYEVNNFKQLCLDVAQKCQIIPEYMELAKLTVDRLAHHTSEMDDERATQTVVGAFEALWNVMSSYCAKLATALGIPHSVEDTIPASETLVNLIGKFGEFSRCIVNFILSIEGILNVEDTTSMDEKIMRLEAAFGESWRLARVEQRPAREPLRVFCLTNRNMLKEAAGKFSQLAQVLEACKRLLPQLTN